MQQKEMVRRMKAKEYFEELKQCETVSDLTAKTADIYARMVEEMNKLIKNRNAKTHSKVAGCIREIDDKFRAMADMWNKYSSSDEATELHKKYAIKPAFFECLVSSNKQYMSYYDVLRPKVYKKALEEYNKKQEERLEKIKNEIDDDNVGIYFHKVTPLDQITKENITKEILSCLMSLGNFHSTGLNINYARPLAARITFLRHWQKDGIDYSEIPEFEKDPFEYTKKYVTM